MIQKIRGGGCGEERKVWPKREKKKAAKAKNIWVLTRQREEMEQGNKTNGEAIYMTLQFSSSGPGPAPF